MTTDQVQAIGPEFTALCGRSSGFLRIRKPFSTFATIAAGCSPTWTARRLSRWPSMQARHPACLQQFLKACLWDHEGLSDGVQQTLHTAVGELPPDPVGTVGILDETSALKKGNKTPGVQRQYLGCVGKVANGIVTVHLIVAHGRFKALLDSELFLPQSWDADRERCRQADIPDELSYRPKSDIALESPGAA